MKAVFALFAAALVAVLGHGMARANDDLRAAMEADNARWLAAYNTNSPAEFLTMYAEDAYLLPPGSAPIKGRQAIEQFWENRLKPGNRKNHTFEILSVAQDGSLAYQVARWTVQVTKEGGEITTASGNTIRVFERKPDGTLLTKAHIFNVT